MKTIRLTATLRADRRSVLLFGRRRGVDGDHVRPALAQTAGSVLNCEIPVPGPHAAVTYIGQDGAPVAPGTPGAAPPLARPLRGRRRSSVARPDAARGSARIRSGLRQLHSPPAVGDERLHLLRLAADAALTGSGDGRHPLHRRSRRADPHRRARRALRAVPRAFRNDHIVVAPAPEIWRIARRSRRRPAVVAALSERFAFEARMAERRSMRGSASSRQLGWSGGMRHSSPSSRPVAFRIGSVWRAPLDALGGSTPPTRRRAGICDFTVRLEPEKPCARHFRPSVAIRGDYVLPTRRRCRSRKGCWPPRWA